MKLLSHDAVRTVKRTLESEAIERIGKLRAEETRLCKSFAALKADIETKKARLLADYQDSMVKLSVERNSLLSEVIGLERRKSEAQRPVDLKVKQLEALREEAAQDLEKALAVREETKALEEKAESMLEVLSDLKNDLSLRQQDVSLSEEKLALEEKRLAESSEILGDKWLEYHKQVAAMNTEFARKNAEIEAGRKANIAYKESLNALSLEQDKARIAIRDGYESLQKARQEILGRKS